MGDYGDYYYFQYITPLQGLHIILSVVSNFDENKTTKGQKKNKRAEEEKKETKKGKRRRGKERRKTLSTNPYYHASTSLPCLPPPPLVHTVNTLTPPLRLVQVRCLSCVLVFFSPPVVVFSFFLLLLRVSPCASVHTPPTSKKMCGGQIEVATPREKGNPIENSFPVIDQKGNRGVAKFVKKIGSWRGVPVS